MDLLFQKNQLEANFKKTFYAQSIPG